jgi:VWFA-related protein
MTKAISQTGATVILVLLVLAAAVLAPAAPLAAQQRAQPPEREFEGEVTVSEVLLDVLVTDKKGQVIIGLGPDDFVVRENGEEVPITGVTFYSNSRFVEPGDSAQAKGLEIDRVPVDRYFVLFFHDQRRDFAPRAFQTERQLLDAARKASEWVLNEMLPTDWVAVASYDVKLRLHQDFTHDKQALLSALDDAAVSKGGENWPSRIGEGDGPSLARSLPQGKALSKETRTIYEALTLLAEAAGEVVGRKNLVLFSRGFGDVGPGGIYQPDPRYYGDMEQALNDNNVAVYSVDLTPSEVDHTMAAALNQLAAETGGRYYFNFTTFAIPLRRIADENSGYYLLSYESRRPAGESGFQKVEVKTTNPAFDVSARKGYAYGEGS